MKDQLWYCSTEQVKINEIENINSNIQLNLVSQKVNLLKIFFNNF